MKLFRFGSPRREKPGIIDPDGVLRDISPIYADLSGAALAPASLERLRHADLQSLPPVPEGARLGPCIGGTRNFIAVGLNYADHAKESGMAIPTEPVLFNKAPSCIVGPNDDIEIPRGSQKLDFEVEAAVVIGERASYIKESEAPAVISGYCICHDVSSRDFQLEGTGQWMKGKGCPTFGPLGPWLVTTDEIENVQALSMWLDVNGEPMQRGSTSTMIFGVHFLVAYISKFIALEPGDVITTGTPPGVGMGRKPPRYLKAGNKISLGITGLGEQHQRVVSPLAG